MKRQMQRIVALFCVMLATGLIAGCSKAAKKQRHLAKASAHFQAGEYDKAEIECLHVLRLENTNRVAFQTLGFIFHEQGRTIEAFRALSRAKELDPTNLEVRLRLGLTLASGGGIKDAREEAVYVLDHSATNDEALMLLVDSSLGTNDLRDAQQRLEKLRPVAALHPGFHLAWGGIHLRQRDPAKAEASFRQALAVGTNFAPAHLAMGNLHVMKRELKEAEAEFKQAADLSPLRSARRLRYADFKAGTGDVTGARQLLEDLEKRVPDYLPGLLRLAELNLAQRKFDECEALLKRVLARDPLNLEALNLSPRLRVAKGEAEKAVADFEKLLKLNPRNPQTHYRLAVAALMNNDQTKALNSLAQAITLAPDYAEAVVLQAELNLRRGDAAAAVSSLTRFTRKYPGFLQGQLLLASAQRASGNLDGALAIYLALTRGYPTNPQPAFLAGLIQREQRKNTDARASFEQALQVAPEYLSAHAQLVGLDLAEKKLDDAQKRAEDVVAKNPKSPQPLMILTQVHAARTNQAQVEATLLKAIEIAPDFAPAQVQLAKLYVATRRQQEALQRLQGIVARNTNDLMSWMQIGILHTEATNYTAAIGAYERILALNPKFGPALNNMAWLYSEHLNDLTRAYEFARKASDLQPDEPATADTLGWVLFKRGDYGRALTVLQDSARKLPNEAEVQYHLGMTHYMLGEEAPATVALKDALQLSADFPGRDEAQRRLEILAINPAKLSPEQAADLEKSLKQNPQDPILLARAASVYQRTGETDKAVDAYERALKQNPNSVAVLVKLAQLYAGRPGKADDALDLARKAHNLAPEDDAISHTLGAMAMAAGDSKWALSLLEQSARRLSSDPQVLYDLALARYSVGLVESAAEAMRSAQTNAPAAALASAITEFLTMKAMLANPQQADASLAEVRESAKARTNNVPALMVLASVESRKGNAAEAGRLYENILAVYAAFTPAMRELAILCFGPLKDHEKAHTFAARVRETDRSDLDIARILGFTSYERGEFTRAAELLTEYCRQRSQDAEAFYQLGLVRQKLKQVKECKDALNTALSLQPNATFAVEAKRILAELK